MIRIKNKLTHNISGVEDSEVRILFNELLDKK